MQPVKRLAGFFFGLLLVLMGCTTAGERARMRAGLDSINTRNRNDQPFTVQDVDPYVRFFDRHGSPNDQLLAHYLLGRAYYEHSEVPMALQCYHDALDCADTTAQDCDYAQLARVYGQMALVFYQQGLFRQQLELGKQSVKYAWLAKDTLAALMSYEQESFAYSSLGMPDSAIFVIEDVASKYRQYGYPTYAAISLYGIIRTLIQKGELRKAKQYMDIYESKSGLFDAHGNIAHGREIYYNTKGCYYLETGRLDSAEYYFRKELSTGKDFNNQNAAALDLAEFFLKQDQKDSAAKYALYAYAMSDSLHAHRNTQDVERIQSMYNYSRQQVIAQQETKKTTKANIRLLITLIILLVLFLIASWLYIARKQVAESLRRTLSELATVREELSELQQNNSDNEQAIMEKEQRIRQLELKLGKYGKIVYFGVAKVENDLQLSPSYQKIKGLAYRGLLLHEAEWDIVHQLINEYFPGYHEFLNAKLKMNTTEYQVCQLLRLHFKAGEIANMLSVSPPYISKICTTVLAILFNKKGSSRELAKELVKIN